MKKILGNSLGQLRLIALLEGLTLLALVFITVPMKYIWNNPIGSEILGPVHGGLFLAYVYLTFIVSVKYKWKFSQITWKVLLASFIPFGTFYVDKLYFKNPEPRG